MTLLLLWVCFLDLGGICEQGETGASSPSGSGPNLMTIMTESPLRNIWEMNLSLWTSSVFSIVLPFLCFLVHISMTSSNTLLKCPVKYYQSAQQPLVVRAVDQDPHATPNRLCEDSEGGSGQLFLCSGLLFFWGHLRHSNMEGTGHGLIFLSVCRNAGIHALM